MGNKNSSPKTSSIERVKLINFNVFKRLGSFPRCPDSNDVTVEFNTIDRDKSFIVYISHCWHIRQDDRSLGGGGLDISKDASQDYEGNDSSGFDGIPKPDCKSHGQYKLCVEGIEKIIENFAPGMKNCYVWVDYSCIDQDVTRKRTQKAKSSDLLCIQQHMHALTISDCLFTPVFGLNTNFRSVNLNSGNSYSDYQADDWNCNNVFSYLNRGWCRFDMFCAANLPLHVNGNKNDDSKEDGEGTIVLQNNRSGILGSETVLTPGKDREKDKEKENAALLYPAARAKLCRAGLAYHLSSGVRAHFVYGTSEHTSSQLPIIFPPLRINSKALQDYDPIKGHFSFANDKDTVKSLVDDITSTHKASAPEERKPGYYGETKNKKYHGMGVYIYPDGAMYEGTFALGKKSGRGTYSFTDGSVYQGEFQDGRMHGKGRYQYANGDVYEGDFSMDLRQGKGIFTQSNGNIYDGEFDGGKRHGKALVTYLNGSSYEGDFTYDTQSGMGIYRDVALNEVYEGGFVDGKRHGRGHLTSPAGDFEVDYIDDKIQSKKTDVKKSLQGTSDPRKTAPTAISTDISNKGSRASGAAVDSSSASASASKSIVSGGGGVQDQGKSSPRSDTRATPFHQQRSGSTSPYRSSSNHDQPPSTAIAGNSKDRSNIYSNSNSSSNSNSNGNSNSNSNRNALSSVFSYQNGANSSGNLLGMSLVADKPHKRGAGSNKGRSPAPSRDGSAKGSSRGGGRSKEDIRPYFYIYPDGSQYFGTYQNGKRKMGTYTYIDGCQYIGEYVDGRMHGKGTYKYTNGDVYEGSLAHGMFSGQGVLRYANGGRYEGQFQSNMKNGLGKYVYPSGSDHPSATSAIDSKGRRKGSKSKEYYYEGEYLNDQRHGTGVCHYPNGDVYEGGFQGGLRHGQGTYRYSNGSEESGVWENGVLVF